MFRRPFLAASLALAFCAHAATATREVVRIPYGDTKTLDELGGRFGHLDVDRKNHVARVDVDADDRAWLETRGLKVEVDREASDALARSLAPRVKSIGGFSCFRTVEETQATQDALVAAHPYLARIVDIGDSWAKAHGAAPGYDLRVLRIENFAVPGPKPTLFVMSGIHAREYAPVELATRFAEWLLGQYAIDPTATWLVDHYAFHLLLEANPDGRKQAEAGASWRKNTNTDYCGPASSHRGADLNRNFPLFWGTVPTGSSPNACDDTYHGPVPASEPEVQAVRDYLAQVFPDTRPGDPTDLLRPADPSTQGLFFDLHSFAQLVLWPWGTSHTLSAPDDAALATLGRRLAAFNGYRPEKSSELYLTDGTTDDFAYGTFGVPAYTMEIGTAFFQDCSTFEQTVFPQNFDALKYASRVLAAPYRWPGGPDARNLVATPAIALPTEAVEVRALIDDSRFNQDNGVEQTQAIAGARLSVDVAPTVATSGGQAMTALDGVFDTPTESATLTLPAGSLAHGRHLVYVQGTDASGERGAPDAVWVEVLDSAQIASLDGHVRDSVTAAPLAATVRTTETSVATASDGRFDFPRLHTGAHSIVAHADGYIDEQLSLDLVGGSTQNREIALTPECRLFADNVEGADPGWSAGGWKMLSVSGPDGASTNAWTTGPYPNNTDDQLLSPALDFSASDGVRLEFDDRCDTESGFDFGLVDISTDGGSTWSEAWRCSGDPQWRHVTLDLPTLDHQSNVRILFRLNADASVTGGGVTLDNIVVASAGGSCRASRALLASAQHGLSGTWYNPATSGQGFTFEVFPSSGQLAGGWFTYASGAPGGDSSQRWLSLSGPVSTMPGATNLTIYRNIGGNFDAAPATSATAVGTATLAFSSCTNAQLSYQLTDGSGASGTIPLTRLTSNIECGAGADDADFGLSGNWYDPATSGQGFIVEINPATPIVFATWYTYASNGAAGADGQRWYTLQSSNARAGARRFEDLVIYQTTGGTFDAVPGPRQVTQAVGTATLTFDSCAAAHVSYAFTTGTNAGRTGTIDLQRAGPAPASCRF